RDLRSKTRWPTAQTICSLQAVTSRRTGRRLRSSAVAVHAAASPAGHVAHPADRFAFTRALRAAAARVIRSAGTASPVPKYISSGVCPRNAECGSTRLLFVDLELDQSSNGGDAIQGMEE